MERIFPEIGIDGCLYTTACIATGVPTESVMTLYTPIWMGGDAFFTLYCLDEYGLCLARCFSHLYGCCHGAH